MGQEGAIRGQVPAARGEWKTCGRPGKKRQKLSWLGSLIAVALLLLPACGQKTIQSHPEQLAGVGLILREAPRGAVVGHVIEEGPADGAGLRKGDLVISVDGADVENRSLASIVDMLRGEEGSSVVLEVENTSGRSQIELTRGRLVKSGDGYRAR